MPFATLGRRLFPDRYGRVGRPPPGGHAGAYDRLASWYDWPGALEFAHSCSRIVGELLDRADRPFPDALDVACGTGTFLLDLAGRDLLAVGLDRSAPMLVEARTKLREAGVPARLVRADMRTFRFSRRFALVTCFFDALNHVSDLEGASAALATVADHVAPGGLFVFDTNNRRMYENQWTGPVDEIDVPGGRVRVAYRYDRRTRIGRARVELDPDEPVDAAASLEGWVRHRCHSDDEIRRPLEERGLELIATRPHPHFADEDGGGAQGPLGLPPPRRRVPSAGCVKTHRPTSATGAP